MGNDLIEYKLSTYKGKIMLLPKSAIAKASNILRFKERNKDNKKLSTMVRDLLRKNIDGKLSDNVINDLVVLNIAVNDTIRIEKFYNAKEIEQELYDMSCKYYKRYKRPRIDLFINK